MQREWRFPWWWSPCKIHVLQLHLALSMKLQTVFKSIYYTAKEVL